MDPMEDFREVTERLNQGEPIPSVEASRMEHCWDVVSSIPRLKREHIALGEGAFNSNDPNAEPLTVEQKFAVMVRIAILSALDDLGHLEAYMKEESGRKKVFLAIASMKCDKIDFFEACADRAIRNLPVEQQKQGSEQFRKAGYDPEHLRIVEKFEVLMRRY
jgi:hypothetical protein